MVPGKKASPTETRRVSITAFRLSSRAATDGNTMEQANRSRVERLSAEALALLGTGAQIPPFSELHASFDLAEAYDVVGRVRELRRARGEVPVGRKIGFTNRSVWNGYGISGPIWNYVFDRTVHDASSGTSACTLDGFPEPRIEPELVLHLATAPSAGMDEAELISCIDWVAPGFEIVHSIFPGWRFSAADAAAAFGVHAALFAGQRRDVTADRTQWARALSQCEVEMSNDRGRSRHGCGENVLGGPLQALRFLVDEIARYPACEPLRAGELVTTGTLTEAMPAVAGETWTSRFTGIDLPPLSLSLR
ncbi:MAG: hydratase [Xanthobacteraceae bacterium]|nr:hydratase [Xanthobacteraceae bacterium]